MLLDAPQPLHLLLANVPIGPRGPPQRMHQLHRQLLIRHNLRVLGAILVCLLVHCLAVAALLSVLASLAAHD